MSVRLDLLRVVRFVLAGAIGGGLWAGAVSLGDSNNMLVLTVVASICGPTLVTVTLLTADGVRGKLGRLLKQSLLASAVVTPLAICCMLFMYAFNADSSPTLTGAVFGLAVAFPIGIALLVADCQRFGQARVVIGGMLGGLAAGAAFAHVKPDWWMLAVVSPCIGAGVGIGSIASDRRPRVSPAGENLSQ